MQRILLGVSLGVILVFGGLAEAASVGGYWRQDGTYVAPYQRTDPNQSRIDNYTFPGNLNPNTGTISPGDRQRALQQELWGPSAPPTPSPSRRPWGSR